MPRVNSTSFTDTGTPCRRPSGSPFITAVAAPAPGVGALSGPGAARAGGAAGGRPAGGGVPMGPGAGAPGRGGASDPPPPAGGPPPRLAAVDWTRVDRIPPLAEPARLPAGA